MKRIQARRNVRPVLTSLLSNKELSQNKIIIIVQTDNDQNSQSPLQQEDQDSQVLIQLQRMVDLLEKHTLLKKIDLLSEFFAQHKPIEVSISSAQALSHYLDGDLSSSKEDFDYSKEEGEQESISVSSFNYDISVTRFQKPHHNKCKTEGLLTMHNKFKGIFLDTSQIRKKQDTSFEQNPTDKYILKDLKSHLFISLLTPLISKMIVRLLAQSFQEINKIYEEKMERRSCSQQFIFQLVQYQAKGKILSRILNKCKNFTCRDSFLDLKSFEKQEITKQIHKFFIPIPKDSPKHLINLINIQTECVDNPAIDTFKTQVMTPKQQFKQYQMSKLCSQVQNSMQNIRANLLIEAFKCIFQVEAKLNELPFKNDINEPVNQCFDVVIQKSPQQNSPNQRQLRQPSLEVITSQRSENDSQQAEVVNGITSQQCLNDLVEEQKDITMELSLSSPRKQIRFDQSMTQDSPFINKSVNFVKKVGILKNKYSPFSPLNEYKPEIILGSIEQIVHNGEEVEISRITIIHNHTKLYFIRKNTRNPEELMLLIPRERSNSIDRLDVADVVNLVMDNKQLLEESKQIGEGQTDVEVKPKALLKKRLSRISRANTVKSLLPVVRLVEKTKKSSKESDHFIIIMPPKRHKHKGERLGFKKNVVDIPFFGTYESLEGESSFIKASREYMVDVTPPSSDKSLPITMKSSMRRATIQDINFFSQVEEIQPLLTSTQMVHYFWFYYVSFFNIVSSSQLILFGTIKNPLDTLSFFFNIVIFLTKSYDLRKKVKARDNGMSQFSSIKTNKLIDSIAWIIYILQIIGFNLTDEWEIRLYSYIVTKKILFFLIILFGNLIFVLNMIQVRSQLLGKRRQKKKLF